MCGIFGIYDHDEAPNLTYLGLHALQHRGQESAGIVSTDHQAFFSHREMGLVGDIFTAKALEGLQGKTAIGHVRYSTTGMSHLRNAQPFSVEYAGGRLAIAHNGNLVNAQSLKLELEREGAIFQSSSDSEVLIHLIARSKQPTFETKLIEALRRVQGAFSLLFLTQNQMVAVRDPFGFRPLVLGRLHDAYVMTSETTALDLIGAEYLRELQPGEMVVVDHQGLRSSYPLEPPPRLGRCIFEHVYFAKPDTTLFGSSVHEVRKKMGRQLAKEQPAQADLVIAVPDSGVAAALGFSEQSGIPYDVGLIRSHYVGRTFIEPQQSIRNFGVKLKLSAVKDVLRGRRVVVVDDSIVRGTTSRKIVTMIKAAGAQEVHLRISSPPTQWPCFYGIDTPSRKDLIASNHTTPEISNYVTADSLGYLSVEGMGAAAGDASTKSFCTACFTGKYLTPLEVSPEDKSSSLTVSVPIGH